MTKADWIPVLPGDTIKVYHTSLQTNRLYPCGVTEATRVPIATLEVSNGEDADEDPKFSCEPCRDGEHLLCDGDGCRCVCSLELDEPRRNFA